MNNQVTRQFVKTRSGMVHMAIAGQGQPVIFLHQTPRSWDEYRDVLPLVGQSFRAIAMDTRGFGDSAPLDGRPATIENWADAVIDLADALALERFTVVGHHTGGVIALDLAARYPNRINHLVLSGTSYIDAERRARQVTHRVIDEVDLQEDGQHLAELWQRRRPFYPEAQAADLLSRFIVDAIKAGPMAVEGHRVVNRYKMDEMIDKVRCPTLILAPEQDPHAFPSAPLLAAKLPTAMVQNVPGAMVPFPDQMPEIFAAHIVDFLQSAARKEQ